MKIKHAKSPCCRGRVNHFGKRRRQCAVCKRTWRIRQKRRGRKRQRAPAEIAVRALINGQAYHYRRGGISQSGFSRRLSKTIRRVIRLRKPRFPPCSYALIGDGMYFKFKRTEWVMYILAIKPIRSRKAYFLDPVLLGGREHAERWRQAIAAIPPEINKRIVAFVSWFSGFAGSIGTKSLASSTLPFSPSLGSGARQGQKAVSAPRQSFTGQNVGDNEGHIAFTQCRRASEGTGQSQKIHRPSGVSKVYQKTWVGILGAGAGLSCISPLSKTQFADDHQRD